MASKISTSLHQYACRFILKVIGIGAAERSWGDINTIKSGKLSAISSDIFKIYILFIHLPVLNQL